MNFSMKVYQLEHYLSKAATALGSGQASATMQGFCFVPGKGTSVLVWCTNGSTYTEVEMDVQELTGGEAFILNATMLSSLVAYLNFQGDICFEMLDSGKIEVTSGSYVGEWMPLEKENFPASSKKADLGEQPKLLNARNFCKSVEAVKYAAEGLMGAERRIVFRRGLCWGASGVRYQAVISGLDDSVDIVIPFAALGVVKFLERSSQKEDDAFAYTEGDEYMSFYIGRDVFSCLKAVSSEEDEEFAFGERLSKKNFWCELEVEELQRAVARASLTCNAKSAEIQFEFNKDSVSVVGMDIFGNQGIDTLIISPQGDLSQIGSVKIAGWEWILAALQATKAKAVRICFDQEHIVIAADNRRGILALVSKHNAKRLTAIK